MSGGYEPKPKLYQLVWGEGTPYEGLEVTAKGVSTGAFLEIQEQAEAMSDPPKSDELRTVLRRFGGLLAEWNVTSGGNPVPAAYATCAESGQAQLRSDPAHCEKHAESDGPCEFTGLVALDLDLGLEIFTRWSKAVGGVDPTSPKPSANGATSAAGQPPGLASASRSLASLPEPS
jgi:hypothetical protein